uniref:Probable endopeptidase p60 n=2 Tax=Listeria innocua TaxID=1642 RepID=Q5XWS6_LISIO|nr:invasion-associated protein p60 [Listeria innocua]
MNMKKATIAATAGIAVTAFAAPTIASASTVVVEAGDTLWGIAQSKGTTVDAIKKANNLTTDKIVPGQKLQVNEVATEEKAEKSVSATWLNVRSGAGVDHSILTSIKGGTKVTVETTESNGWHKITYNDGKTGYVNGKYLTDKATSTPVVKQEVKKETTQQVKPATEAKTEVKQPTTQQTAPAPKAAETKEAPVVDQNATTHNVKSGDTIWALSVKYGVSVQDIMSWNNLSSSSIYVGQKLAIKQPTKTVAPKAETKTQAPAAEKQTAPAVKENSNANTATTEKKETATEQQTTTKAPTQAAKPAPAPSTNTNKTNTTNNNTNASTPSKNTNTNTNTNTNQGSTNNASASALIAEAQKHLGKAYSWGGNGPTTFDCSGFTKYVFAKSGISLPRTSGAQYASTTRISESQAKPGDLVFFDYGSGISHVGIYVGNGQMINAQDNGVKYDNIHGAGWGKFLVGFGRV